MQSFTKVYLEKRLVVTTPAITQLTGEIREYKGKQLLYAERKPEILDSLRQVALIESVESSNRLEHIQIARKDLQKLVQRKVEPQNRPQTELAGYRDVLETIHQHHDGMRFSPSLIRQLHRDLLQHTAMPGGDFKGSDNDIVEKNEKGQIIRIRLKTVSPSLTPIAMDNLQSGYDAAKQLFDPLLLIPNYVHDFLCIHPFPDGNGRMARLLTVLLLYKHGYEVARYISIERLIEDTKDSYYESLALSDIGWHDGTHDYVPFTEYMLGIILKAYRRLEQNVVELGSGHGYKTALVKHVIDGLPDIFSIRDVEERCGSVSRDTIKNVLQSQRQQGILDSFGKGPAARWKKIGE